MWTREQQYCFEEVIAVIKYAMERKLQGNISLNLIGNGMIGKKIECKLFFPVTAGGEFTDDIAGMHKNIVNAEAARQIKNILKEV